jgi:hypothetical protein
MGVGAAIRAVSCILTGQPSNSRPRGSSGVMWTSVLSIWNTLQQPQTHMIGLSHNTAGNDLKLNVVVAGVGRKANLRLYCTGIADTASELWC